MSSLAIWPNGRHDSLRYASSWRRKLKRCRSRSALGTGSFGSVYTCAVSSSKKDWGDPVQAATVGSGGAIEPKPQRSSSVSRYRAIRSRIVLSPSRKMPSHHDATLGRRKANTLASLLRSRDSRIGLITLRVELNQGLTRLLSMSGCQNMLQMTDPMDLGCMLSVM